MVVSFLKMDHETVGHKGNRKIFLAKENIPGKGNTESQVLDFPGGLAVKNLLVNGGDTGSIPGPGRLHMPQSDYGHGY